MFHRKKSIADRLDVEYDKLSEAFAVVDTNAMTAKTVAKAAPKKASKVTNWRCWYHCKKTKSPDTTHRLLFWMENGGLE